jgi:hypothetical protein
VNIRGTEFGASRNVRRPQAECSRGRLAFERRGAARGRERSAASAEGKRGREATFGEGDVAAAVPEFVGGLAEGGDDGVVELSPLPPHLPASGVDEGRRRVIAVARPVVGVLAENADGAQRGGAFAAMACAGRGFDLGDELGHLTPEALCGGRCRQQGSGASSRR